MLIIALAGKLTSFFGIIFTAFFLSFALEPGVNWFAARGWRRGVATGLIFFIVFLAGVGLVALVIPAIVTGAMQLIEAAPDLVDRLVKFANDLGWNISAENLTDQIQQNAQDLAGAASSLAGNVFGIAASILGGIFRWATIALFTFYIVAEGPKLRRAVCSALPPKNQERVLFVWDQAIEKTGGYFYSRLLLAVINGVGMYITLARLQRAVRRAARDLRGSGGGVHPDRRHLPRGDRHRSWSRRCSRGRRASPRSRTS